MVADEHLWQCAAAAEHVQDQWQQPENEVGSLVPERAAAQRQACLLSGLLREEAYMLVQKTATAFLTFSCTA